MSHDNLFEDAIDWLRQHYSNYRFYAERDIVWTVQTRLTEEIERRDLPYRVFNDYTLPSRRRTDLVIFHNDSDKVAEVAVEFKYEPSHQRSSSNRGGDIPKGKFPVVFWDAVEKDIQRVREYVALGESKIAYSILIDEGSWFRWRQAPDGSEWIDWSESSSILWSKQPPIRQIR